MDHPKSTNRKPSQVELEAEQEKGKEKQWDLRCNGYIQNKKKKKNEAKIHSTRVHCSLTVSFTFTHRDYHPKHYKTHLFSPNAFLLP